MKGSLYAVSLTLITLAVFRGACGHEFVLIDDDRNVYQNPMVNAPEGVDYGEIWRIPGNDEEWQRHNWMYLPVTKTAWGVLADATRPAPDAPVTDSSVAGLEPGPFHVANIALHALNALLVFALLRLLRLGDLPAAAGAALFAIHPVQVEPVAWVSGFRDLLSGFFALLALCGYVLFTRSSAQRRIGAARVLWSGASICFALALLAKPSAVIVPLVAGALALGVMRIGAVRAAATLSPWLLVAAAVVPLARVQKIQPSVAELAPWQRLVVAGDALSFYLRQLVFPWHLAPLYGRTPEAVLAGDSRWVTGLLPLVLVGVAATRYRRAPVPATAFAILVIGVSPVLGFVPFTFQEFSTVADRYLYLALIGPALWLAWSLGQRPSRRVWTLAAIGLAAAGVRASFQVGHWRDSEAILEHTLAVDPHSAFAHNNLGHLAMTRGEPAQAVAEFEQALDAKPDYVNARKNLAVALGELGRWEEAERHLRTALEQEPDFAEAHFNLGVVLARTGRKAAAELAYQRALEVDPRNVLALINLGVLATERGDAQEGARRFRAALDIDSLAAAAHANLGLLLAEQGKRKQANWHLRRAMQLEPDLSHLERFVIDR